jgi:hypothetical protein
VSFHVGALGPFGVVLEFESGGVVFFLFDEAVAGVDDRGDVLTLVGVESGGVL